MLKELELGDAILATRRSTARLSIIMYKLSH